MRPDRTIVIRHRVVTRLAAGDSTNSPSRKGCFIGERARYALSVVLCRNTREKTVTGVRRAHPARPFAAVQRKRICGKLFTPEDLLEPVAQALGLLFQVLRNRLIAQQSCQLAGNKFGSVHVTLHFTQSDRSLRERAVTVKN